MTRPTLDIASLARTGVNGDSGFEGLWAEHNTLDAGTDDERTVPKPAFIEDEAPEPGQTSRRPSSTARTQPEIHIHDKAPSDISYADAFWNSQDYDLTARLEVVVAEGIDGQTGKQTREDILNVLENTREAQRAPVGGVFGSEYRSLKLANMDRTPTQFSNQWRCYYDVRFTAFSVV